MIKKIFIISLCWISLSVNANPAWDTYQGNQEHTGYVPTSLDESQFELKWQVPVGNARALNPVTAADNKVFVSVYGYFDSDGLFTLDSETGQTLWSKDFGRVFSVNPPAYANGRVFIQTGNHGSDTYLRSYDADTGDLVFQSNHSAQWERYYAPTIVDDVAYINGGYYGGMYAFDAINGEQKWFRPLPQYSQWTPAVDDNYAYSYVYGRLYAVNRDTGDVAYYITDNNYSWRGYSMNLAPALGGANDIFVIYNGRLIRFNLSLKNINYELKRNFSGQPSIARGIVYAVDSGALTAWDQITGTLLWSWASTSSITGTIVVTDSHAFVSDSNKTYAIDLQTHQSVWDIPTTGHLALADKTLYIASIDGVLTAINVGLPPDRDGDGVADRDDNCADTYNPEQNDTDGDGVGDACNDTSDSDNDEWSDHSDNCPLIFNPLQENADQDSYGDVCDPYPLVADNLMACLDDRDDYAINVNNLMIANSDLNHQIDILEGRLSDDDNDEVIDTYDACLDSQEIDVDSKGCSINQFCSAFSSPQYCNNADWKNDEPLNALDCKWASKQCLVR